MNWTFGIITHDPTNRYIGKVIDSIYALNIPKPNFEILIIGGQSPNKCNRYSGLIHMPFDDLANRNWITRKKNLIAQNACYENLVITHDYVEFDKEWYKNFTKFGGDWDVCMNRIENTDGKRFRDWVTYEAKSMDDAYVPPPWVDYKDHSKTNAMYVSGTYFCVKRDFLCKNPLNETLYWGMSEDVEWSLRIRNNWKYRCNSDSVVRFLKTKEHFPFPLE